MRPTSPARSGNTLNVTITGSPYRREPCTSPATPMSTRLRLLLDSGSYLMTTIQPTPFAIGPLSSNYNGYGIYNWGGRNARTRTSDTEGYTEHSDLTTAIGNLTSYGIASNLFTASGVTNPSITWSGGARAALSFVTLNPPPGGALLNQTINVTTAAPASALYGDNVPGGSNRHLRPGR